MIAEGPLVFEARLIIAAPKVKWSLCVAGASVDDN